MQLDRTAISIKQRDTADLLDLGLVVIRTYWRPLLLWSLMGCFPWFILNFLVLYPTLQFEDIFMVTMEVLDEADLERRYLALQFIFVLSQAPLALLGTTYFLGQSVFVDQPKFSHFLSNLKVNGLAIFVVVGLLRGGIVALPLLFWLGTRQQVSLLSEIWIFGVLFGGWVLFRKTVRPFATEVLLLEKSPLMVSKGSMNISYFRRAVWLHRPLLGILFNRFVIVSLIAVAAMVSLCLLEMILCGAITGRWGWGWWMNWIFFPANLWAVATWATVIRFLSYLDARTRLEGWEVELRLRAEGQRILETL